LFMALVAALKTLLYLYLGQEDLRVATLVANRNRPGTEGVIGPFANTTRTANLSPPTARANRRDKRFAEPSPPAGLAIFALKGTLLHGSAAGRSQPPAPTVYARRTYSGRPSSSMRFSNATAMATSVVCRPSVRERSASPITRL